jgi:UDP-glucose 4-epimerase
MRVLITGGAGFVGSHLCARLLRRGDEVVALDDLSRGRADFLEPFAGRPDFRFVRADCNDPKAMDDALDRPTDAIVHLAANSDIAASNADRRVDLDATFRTTFAVAEAAGRHRVGQVVFASTSAVYGEVDAPTREDHGPLVPISFYGAAKLASEAWLCASAHRLGFRAWVVRFPNVVGEHATHGVLFDFLARLRADPSALDVLGDGRQRKLYLYVHDLLDGLDHVWRHAPADPVAVVNLGPDGPGTTVRTIAETVVRELGLDVPIRYGASDRGWPGDVPRFDLDLSRARALGWRARLSSDEAVTRAVRALLGHPNPPW